MFLACVSLITHNRTLHYCLSFPSPLSPLCLLFLSLPFLNTFHHHWNLSVSFDQPQNPAAPQSLPYILIKEIKYLSFIIAKAQVCENLPFNVNIPCVRPHQPNRQASIWPAAWVPSKCMRNLGTYHMLLKTNEAFCSSIVKSSNHLAAYLHSSRVGEVVDFSSIFLYKVKMAESKKKRRYL